MDDEIDQFFNEVDHGVWAKKSRQLENCLPGKSRGGSDVGLGLAETLNAIASFPLAAFLEEVHALEAFEDVALNDETGSALEAFVL
jgi:hypothetical protein